MKKILLTLFVCFIAIGSIRSQESTPGVYLPKFAVKTNALYWATSTTNLGMEFALSPKHTLDISGNWNPFTYSHGKKLKHWGVQPEFRYWTCERFNGHFFGIHAHYADFNVANIKQLGLKGRKYQGDLYGAGVSYGYQWVLGNHWNLEATIGLGYARINYDKYEGCGSCGKKVKDGNKNYFGPTKVGLSLIYVIK